MTSSTENILPILRELEKVDRRIREVHAGLQLIPNERNEKGTHYLQIKGELDQKESQVVKITKERLSLEQDVQQLVEEAKKKEERINAIKTQQEYQASLKEIASIRQANKEKEERIIALMEIGEKLNDEIAQLKSKAAEQVGDYQALEKDLTEREAAFQKEEMEILQKRPELLKGLTPELLKKYEKSRKRYVNGIVGVLRGICQGCFMNIPPQFFNEMLKLKDLRQCPNCSRLIYALLESETAPRENEKANEEA